ncbi:uncharacterized protein LOC117095220 [Trachypithecus francoisi]|uniref:uncharacterized protein LOC117095220 n=1 Tax=Trachypithecus francoisi TaxID=54180 RepID=UPI00141A9068|nr:uncharacterized protein LOC117095220 [Trachypithecus francoisi]
MKALQPPPPDLRLRKRRRERSSAEPAQAPVVCWGYRGSEHLPHTGRTLAPMFTMLRETFGGQQEASREMGPPLSRGRARACPTSLLAAPWAAAPWQLELEGFSESS